MLGCMKHIWMEIRFGFFCLVAVVTDLVSMSATVQTVWRGLPKERAAGPRFGVTTLASET